MQGNIATARGDLPQRFSAEVPNSIRVFIAYSYIQVTIWRQTRCQIKKFNLTVFFRTVILYHVSKFWAGRKTQSKVMGAEAQIFVNFHKFFQKKS